MTRKHSVTRDYSTAARLTAAFVVVSLVAVVGIAAMTGAAVADHGGDIPDSQDLDSDEVLVDDDFESGEVADDDQLYPNIQDAVNNSTTGGTVYVREGDYPESVSVDKRVDLIGAGIDEANVTGASVALTITGDDVTVHGFSFNGSDSDNVVEVLGLSSSGDVKNLEFSDNKVRVGDDAKGLYHEPMDQDQPSHDETLIADNVFTPKDGAVQDPVQSRDMIHIDAGSSAVPHNITIEGNLFTNPTHQTEDTGQVDDDVVDVEANDTSVRDNTFNTRVEADEDHSEECGENQIEMDGNRNVIENNLIREIFSDCAVDIDLGYGGTENVVRENQIEDAHAIGIDAEEQDELVVNGNEIRDTDGPGMNLEELTDSVVTSNLVDGSEDIGIQIEDSDNVTVGGNNVLNTHSIGVWVFDSTGVLVEHNLLSNNEIGSQVDGEGDSGPEGHAVADGTSSDVLYENNEFVGNSDVGINFSDFANGTAIEDRPEAHYNDFSSQGHDVQNLHPQGDRVDARLNWFGVNNYMIDYVASSSGDVLLDPYLTDMPSNVNQDMDQTQKYFHDFRLDGSADDEHVIAVPGPGDRTVGEAFADLPAGSQLWAYDNQNGQWVMPSSGDNIEDLDAFVVTGLDSDATVVFGFANDGAASPSNADLSQGWNLVGAPRKDEVDDAFDQFAGTGTSVIHSIEAAKDVPAFMTGVDASGTPGAWQSTVGQGDANCVSPYTGYWLYVDDDDPGGLPSNMADGVSFNDAIDLLRTDMAPCAGS